MAIVTRPTAAAWRRCAAVYLTFAACALVFGFATGFLKPGPVPLSPIRCITLILLVLVTPALVEELIFRAALLPQDARSVPRRRLWLQAALALLAYVLSHVLNALLFHRSALPVFTNPRFLTLAAMLGAACTAAYLTSRSLWPAVLLHWVAVCTWLVLLGGFGRLWPAQFK